MIGSNSASGFVATPQAAHRFSFFNALTSPELIDITEAHLPEHRERLYPPTVTLSMFLHQALASDSSCQRAVNAWAAGRAAEGLSAAQRTHWRLLSGPTAPARVDGAGADPAHCTAPSAASREELALAGADP